MINFDKTQTFEGGYSTDITDNIERKNTFAKNVNGRLYSKNGVFSISSVDGGKLIYQNNQIVKYLGFHSFRDETLVFAKCLKPTLGPPNEEQVCTTIIESRNFEIGSFTNTADLQLTNEFSVNSGEFESCYDVVVPEESDTDFEIKFACDGVAGNVESIDLKTYYGTYQDVPNFETCTINLGEIPINNLEYYDCIISLKHDNDFNLVGTLLWIGTQNWPLNGKITTEGVEENQFYKRVYYTDAINPRRVVNTKDTGLIYRTGDEFNQILNNVLLQPEIKSIDDGGQLNAMKSQYIYRIISENGQRSEFSPTSEFATILVEDTPIRYRGGNISEVTGRSVTVQVNIINPESTSEIECIALEYEASGPPTAIRNLGTRPANVLVEFKHFGNESEESDNITLSDITAFTNTWKYCNDFTSKKNKLIAGGLRNDPVPSAISNLEYLFPLHAWDETGASHDCLMNPEPWKYRYIDPSNTDDMVYIKQKVYRTISSFGDFTLTFKNKVSGDFIEIVYDNLSLESYTNLTSTIADWLIDQKINNVNFDTYFPNLTIVNSNGQVLLTPTDELIQTNMSDYIFESNNNQFIENFDNDLVFLNVGVNTSNLVWGGQSIGYNDGVGLRITYREFKEPLLNQATGKYLGTGSVLDFEAPSGTKYCMKGEIYRLAFQAYDNDSTRFFAIPLGDVMIPSIGDLKLGVDDLGNSIITSQRYTNQSVENGVLYGHGIKMHIEVRLSCELQKEIPMYQILYVERDEDNRTILCQGISAPLEKVAYNNGPSWKMEDALRNKWNLPYYGGPTYEKRSFENYDTYGENAIYEGDGWERRVMAHRALMYFDSPDIYYNKISSQYITNSSLDIVGKLNTDHTGNVIRERGNTTPGRVELYPKFSRKITEDQIEGNNNSENLPKYDIDEGSSYSGTDVNHFINVSVYANYTPYKETKQIDISRELKYGEIISGDALNIANDVSNNAACMPNQPWYYGEEQRDWGTTSSRPKYTVFSMAMTSPGYSTVMLKTQTDLFTETFFGTPLPTVNNEIRVGGIKFCTHYDTIPLININRNNRESVYGGRTKEAYSRNTYIPLSKTIPTLVSSNATQFFDVGADVYVTLNIRTKNDFGDDEVRAETHNNHHDGRDRGDIRMWSRNGAWNYAVVLESQVEPKQAYEYAFYKENGTHDFDIARAEVMNEAYFNENNIKSYIPQPFKFKDDPNQGNVVAVSDVKLAGENYDSWTVFKPNNFYAELEKNKGDISNLIKENDQIWAIQEDQTSLIYIGTDRIVNDAEGMPINIQQGSGTVVDGHKIMSKYGTAIRRAVVENDGYGFCFFDEKHVEFIKVIEPMLVANFLHLHYWNLFKTNPVIDTESYFDHENKETNIRLRTKNGTSYMISYNENKAIKRFNGEIEFNNDLYIMFDKKVYAPITLGTSEAPTSFDLHQLNEGDPLLFFNEQKLLNIGYYVNSEISKIFQYKTLGVVCNLAYPMTSIFFKSNLGYDRTVFGNHNGYKIREGNHTVPAINDQTEFYGVSDVRGNWVYVEIIFESLNKNKVDILATINSLRFSHQ